MGGMQAMNNAGRVDMACLAKVSVTTKAQLQLASVARLLAVPRVLAGRICRHTMRLQPRVSGQAERCLRRQEH